jgi:cytochrome b561
MPPTGRNEVPAAAVNLHFSIGIMILILFAVRFISRLAHPVPMEASLPGWQKRLAHAAHSLLYALVFATLLAGWAHASVRGWPIKLLGICAVDSETGHFIGTFQETFAVMFLALIGIHVAGVIFHHFIQGDRILGRMLPREGR